MLQTRSVLLPEAWGTPQDDVSFDSHHTSLSPNSNRSQTPLRAALLVRSPVNTAGVGGSPSNSCQACTPSHPQPQTELSGKQRVLMRVLGTASCRLLSHHSKADLFSQEDSLPAVWNSVELLLLHHRRTFFSIFKSCLASAFSEFKPVLVKTQTAFILLFCSNSV